MALPTIYTCISLARVKSREGWGKQSYSWQHYVIRVLLVRNKGRSGISRATSIATMLLQGTFQPFHSTKQPVNVSHTRVNHKGNFFSQGTWDNFRRILIVLRQCKALLPMETRNAPETATTRDHPSYLSHREGQVFWEKRKYSDPSSSTGNKPGSQMPLSFTRGEK